MEQHQQQDRKLKISPRCTFTDYFETSLVRKSFVYTWVVGNFANYRYKPGEYIVSPTFRTCSSVGPLDWKLELYPRGPTAAHELSLILTLLSDIDSQLRANVEIALVGCKKTETSKHTTKFNQAKTKSISFSFHSLKPDVFHSNLFYGNITVRCELIFEDVLYDNPAKDLKAIERGSKVVDCRSDDFERLLDNEEYSDIKIVVESKEFRAHKCILAARSRVFSAMFKHNMKENNENLIRIKDFSFEVVKEMLRFIYAGKIENFMELAPELLMAADKYELNGLKSSCERTLINDLNSDNVMELLNFAERCNFTDLKVSALNYFINHRDEFVDKEDLKDAIEALPPLLATTISAMMLEPGSPNN